MRSGWTVRIATAVALSALALAVLALALAAAPASAGDGAWGAVTLADEQNRALTVKGESATILLDVQSDGLHEDECLYLGARELPSGWSQDVPGAVATAKGFQIPQGEAEWALDLDVGEATPSGTYELEVGLDRGYDLSELASVMVTVEVTPYTFTATLDGVPTEPVAPGSRVSSVLWVRHDAPQPETARVTVRSSPPDWQVFVGQPMLAVRSAEPSATQLLMQLPQGYPPGASTVILQLTSPDPRFAPALIEAVVDVAELPGLSLVSAPPLQQLQPGSSAWVNISLANTGNVDLKVASVAVDARATDAEGWHVHATALPMAVRAKGTATLRALVSAPSGDDRPLAGEHQLPVVVATDLKSVTVDVVVRVQVGEVRALAFAPVDVDAGTVMDYYYPDSNVMSLTYGTVTEKRYDGLPPGDVNGSETRQQEVVPINPYAATTGTGYVEVVDMGNLGRYREVRLSARFGAPVEAVSFTKDSVFLWSGRSWVVAVDITVAAGAAQGNHTVTVTATDPAGGSASTELTVVVYHLSARLDGSLRLVPSPAAISSGDAAERDGIVLDEGAGIEFAGTVVSTCDADIPYAEVHVYDVHGERATLYRAIPIENLTAREERTFLFMYSSAEPGDHQLVAQLMVPGAVPDDEGREALFPTTVSNAAAPSGWGTIAPAIALGTVAGLGAGLLAILGTEAGMWALLALLLVPLYTRLRPDQVTDQFVRGQILGYVKANPGETYASIKRSLRLSNGQFVYHARVLESQGLIRSVKDGANRRFYPSGMRIPPEIRDLKLNQVQRIIYTIVMEYPGISQRKLAKMVNLSPSTVSYHVNIMTKIGVIERRRSGRLVLCFANGD